MTARFDQRDCIRPTIFCTLNPSGQRARYQVYRFYGGV